MSGRDQLFRRLPNGRFIDINQRDSSTVRPNICAAVKPMPEPAPVTSATLFSKDKFIVGILVAI